MPDADDFDVEYFRNLLKGSSPQEAAASLPAVKKPKKPAAATIAPVQPTKRKVAGKKAGKRR